MLRSIGLGPRGLRGAKGDKGDPGAQGPAGIQGVAGAKGDTGAQGVAGSTGAAGATGATGAPGSKGDTGLTGSQGIKGDTGATGATGPAGSNASATPLGAAAPKALGTATAGTSANAAREDHVHPLPSGLLQFVGNVTVSETTLVALGLGMKRMTLPLAGITAADMGRLVAIPNGTATTGCEVQNAYPTATAGQVSIGYFTPALGLAATYSIPVSIYRIT